MTLKLACIVCIVRKLSDHEKRGINVERSVCQIVLEHQLLRIFFEPSLSLQPESFSILHFKEFSVLDKNDIFSMLVRYKK
jgi:hypothetical protein